MDQAYVIRHKVLVEKISFDGRRESWACRAHGPALRRGATPAWATVERPSPVKSGLRASSSCSRRRRAGQAASSD